MSFSGGVYTLPGPALSTGEIVSATENNQFRNDVATAFNLTFLRNGTSTATANLPMGGYKLTGLGAATTSGDALSYGAAATISDITATGTVTISSGTANGVAYLNGSKVLTTGSALTFDGNVLGLQQSGATGLTITSSASQAYINLRSVAAGGYEPFIGFGDASAGNIGQMLGVNGGGIRWTVSGSEQMRLTSTGLGIGTSSPSGKLHVKGGNNNSLFVDNDGSQYTSMYFKNNGGSNVAGLWWDNTAAGSYLFSSTFQSFYVNNAERMRLDSSGNLGLGVTPSAWLSSFKALQVGTAAVSNIANRAYLTANWYANSSGTDIYIASDYSTMYRQQNGQHQFLTAPSGTAGNPITFTQAMTLDASGNLGVGTSSPGYKLDVNGSVGFSYNNALYSKTSGGSVASFLGYRTVNSESNLTYLENPWHAIAFGTGTSGTSTERMRIDSSGNLLVGKTSATSNGGVIQTSNGITFPATQSACSDANTLDDYEEGTWTPNVGGNATYTTQSGNYTKVGRLVTASFEIQINVLGTGSTLSVSGLPFVSGSVNNGQGGSVGYFSSGANSIYFMTFRLDVSSSTIGLATLTAAGGIMNTSTAFFGNGTRLLGSITYMSA